MRPIDHDARSIAQVASFIGGAALLIGIIGVIWQGAMTLMSAYRWRWASSALRCGRS